jgi:hypothetical protein
VGPPAIASVVLLLVLVQATATCAAHYASLPCMHPAQHPASVLDAITASARLLTSWRAAPTCCFAGRSPQLTGQPHSAHFRHHLRPSRI